MGQMTRRQSIRQAMLFAMGMALGKMDTLKANGGELRVPLDQWQRVVFEFRGKRIAISVSEVFKAIEELS